METTTMADAATAYLDGREFRMLIGGDFVQGGSGQTAPVTNVAGVRGPNAVVGADVPAPRPVANER